MGCPCRIQKRLIRSRYDFDGEKRVYLDYNATTPPDRELLVSYQNLSLGHWGHTASPHGAGGASYRLLRRAEESLEMSFPGTGERLFCSSGSEALLRGAEFLRAWMRRCSEGILYASAVCHPALFAALELLDLPYRRVPVDREGRMRLAELPREGRPIFLYSAVNHETGGIEDCRGIWERAKEAGGWVFTDAVQAFPRLEEAAWLPYCDLFCLSGHKFHVPKGTALLGERGGSFRALNPDYVLPFSGDGVLPFLLARGVEKHRAVREEMNRRLALQEREALHFWKKGRLPVRLESPEAKVPGVMALSLEAEADMEELFYRLAERNVCISRFCACSGSVKGASAVLEAMGRPAERSLRLSGGRETASGDWLVLGTRLREALGA